MRTLLAIAVGILLGFLSSPWPVPVEGLALAVLVPFPACCWIPPGLSWLADGQPPVEGGAP